MALSPITVETIAQELPDGYTVPLSKLFTTLDAEGLPITEYMFSVTGSANIALNGATNLATAAQTAEGDIVVSAADLSKLTLTPTASSGIPDLYVSAYDGVNWSNPTGEALTITTNPSAVSATPGLVMQAGSAIAATSLFTVSGYLDLNPNDTTYTLDPAPGSGLILGNGAYNESTTQYAGTFEVKGSELNFLTYQAPTTPGNYNFVINVLSGNNGQPWSDWEQVNVTVTGPATTAAVEIQNAAAGKPLYAAFVSDSAANVFANLDGLQSNLSAGTLYGISLTDTANPVEQVAAAQFLQDRGAIALISGDYSLSVSGMSATQAIGLTAPSSLRHLISITVADTAANILANLDALQGVVAADHLSAIIVSDPSAPQISLPAVQFAKDSGAISLLTGNYSLSVSGSATQISGMLDGLETQAGKLASVTLTDSGTPALSVSAVQLSTDAQVLGDISGNFTVTVPALPSTISINGLAGHATTIQFIGDAGQYMVSTADGTIGVSGLGNVERLSDVAALQFADYTEIVAAAPGGAGDVTTGNVTELYSAVLGREPDVAGLAFYQSYLQKNPTAGLAQFATWFLDSSEYTSNAAHNYSQSTAGDTQFIEDSYQNLLHRTPSASEISFYLTNVIQPALANLTAGTQAYAAAELQAHAQMLVYFSASSEFLSDVQVTAANPASAQHWLLLTT